MVSVVDLNWVDYLSSLYGSDVSHCFSIRINQIELYQIILNTCFVEKNLGIFQRTNRDFLAGSVLLILEPRKAKRNRMISLDLPVFDGFARIQSTS